MNEKIVENLSISEKENLSTKTIKIPTCCENSYSLDIERLEKKLKLGREKIFDAFFGEF